MDCQEYITEMPKHKKGSHLTQEERMAIRMPGMKCYTIVVTGINSKELADFRVSGWRLTGQSTGTRLFPL